jgi:Kef-type K+ transport system membrane component KefB/mannitol/fructose-specific phosphotransferase system IIA component (Ntr-type)
MAFSILNLLFVLLAAWLAGRLATRLGYPSVLGELLAGILLGPPLLGWLHGGEALGVLAEVGILLMMLYIGMEIDPGELKKASGGGLLAALGGFITPFVLCYVAVTWAGGSAMAGVFVGMAAGVTSLATKSRILVDLKLLDTRIAHVMMAGALIADTLSLILFAGIIGVAEAGSLNWSELGQIGVQALGFFAVATLLGLKVFPVLGRHLLTNDTLGRTGRFTLVLLIALAFAEMAELVGLHGILGAFLAGLFLREPMLGRTGAKEMMHLVRDASLGFLAPVFFVTAGFAVSLDVFQTDLVLLITIVGLATTGKIVGTMLFYLPTGHGWREGLTLGAGMNGRGAVEIIVAQIGLSMGLISQEVFSILVFMAIATTATVPLFLKWGVGWLRRRGELVRSETQRSGALILGAGPTARALAKVLARSQPVWLVDRSAEHCTRAEADGLNVVQGNALDEEVLSRAHAAQAQHFIALTDNAEVNALAARLAKEVFLVPEVHVIHKGDTEGHRALLDHIGGTTLFAGPIALSDWDYRIDHDHTDRMGIPIGHRAVPEQLFSRLQKDHGTLPLAVRREATYLPFHSGTRLLPSDRLIALHLPDEPRSPVYDRFDRLVARCPVLDLDPPLTAEAFFALAAEALAPRVEMTPDALAAAFTDREALSSTVLLPGLAIPHVTVEGTGRFELLMARCRHGIAFPGQPERVHAVFVLVSSRDERTFHLRALAAIAKIVQWSDFERDWLLATDAEALRNLVLRSARRRLPEAPGGDKSDRVPVPA